MADDKKEKRNPIGYKPTPEVEKEVVSTRFYSDRGWLKRLIIAIVNPITYVIFGYTRY